MNSDSNQLRLFADAYQSGLYTLDETIGAMLGVFEKSADNFKLWPELPGWAQSKIWTFLKNCSETTILYDVSTSSSDVISDNLITLKNRLIHELGYK